MDWGRVVEVLLVPVVLGVLFWAVKTLQDVKAGIGELRVTLIGIDGQNGIRGDVKELKERVKDLEEAS